MTPLYRRCPKCKGTQVLMRYEGILKWREDCKECEVDRGFISVDLDLESVAALREERDRLAAEVERLRSKNTELNRRCTDAEGAARDNVEQCRRQGVSLGRGLANWAACEYEREVERLKAALDAVRREVKSAAPAPDAGPQ